MAKKSNLWILASEPINKTARYAIGAAVILFVFISPAAQQFILELAQKAPKATEMLIKIFFK